VSGGATALPGGGAKALPGCAVYVNGLAQCPAIINTTYVPYPNPNALPAQIPGLQPTDIQAAYGLPSASGGYGQTIAVIDKGDDPNAESDLAVYRRTFGLPPCTRANGCFRKSNEPGQTTGTGLPPADASWSGEIALDLDMASATCPNCKLLLVEANTANIQDLATSVDTAVKLGATVISNSYYTAEYNTELGDDKHFNHPNVTITAAAGDHGYGANFPAASSHVTAVGATTLQRASNPRGWTESVWSGTGSGCSVYVTKPSWQHDTGCGKRTIADVSVVGDPNTGVAIYNTYAPVGQQGWAVYGGTSVGAPIVAGIYALAGNAGAVGNAAYLYAHTSALNFITTGSNGSCSPSYLCNPQAGMPGPAGLGSPNGLGAF
jgi:subtilase family serine protease